MLPEIFHYGAVSIQSYGLFLVLSYFTAFFTLRFLATRGGFPPDDFSNLAFFCLIIGVLGGRFFFVLLHWQKFSENWISAIHFWSGGLVFYGGFFSSVLFLFWYFRKKQIPWKNGLDITAAAIALAHAVGRLGCFFAGCCHGRVCDYPWGVRMYSSLVDPSLRGILIHPTQLYEAFGLFIIGLICVYLNLRRTFSPGAAAMFYVSSYSMLRFFVETFRGDANRGSVPFLEMSTSQTISAALFLLTIGIFIRGFRSNH